ncbi:MAG: DUF721 domain-containing protein [Candidatus Omnitrophota bacterium]
MEQIRDIIQEVIGRMAEKRPETQNKIQNIWKNIADGKAVKHTRIASLEKGKLIVCVDSPAWLFQLNMQKGKILNELKKEIDEISGIYFKIGKIK